MLATTCILLIVFLVTVYFYYKFYYFDSKKRRDLQGPEPELVLGNLRNTGLTSGRALHEIFIELKEKHGDVFTFWLGPRAAIVLSRLEDVQHVLTNRNIYDIDTGVTSTFGILFPSGLIALRGDTWKRHARFILPMLKKSKVVPYLDKIVNCTDVMIEEKFVKHDEEIHRDLVAECQTLLMSIFTQIAFDYDLQNSSETGANNLQEAFNDFVYYANKFILYSSLPIWLSKIILFVNRDYQRALHTIKHYLMTIINQEENRQQNDFDVSNRPKTLISSLVSSIKNETSKAKVFLTNEEVFDEVSMLMLGGFETTSTALSWFIFHMSKYPHIQQKIKQELKENHLSYDTPLTQNVLDSLVYVECVTKEVLRFSPIASSISREATQDDIINGIPIRKGETVMLSIQNLQRDPRYWKIDPSKFLPERFLDEDKNPPHCAFLPFGGGHRACAGQDLAFFELKTIITRLMQRVTIEDPGDEADNSGGFIQRITCFPKHLAVRVRVNFD